MDFPEFQRLLLTGEPLVGDILANGKHSVGEIHFYPGKLVEALAELFESGEIKLFGNDGDEQIVLEKLRTLPADEYEIAEVISQQRLKKRSKMSEKEITKAFAEYLTCAPPEKIRKRLIRKMQRWIVLVMMKDFEGQFGDVFLEMQSIAQMRAEREIRNELGMKLLTAEQMEGFIQDPSKKSRKRLLDIKPGGRRERGGFQWTKDCEIKFYETVKDLPRIKTEPAWRCAKKRLRNADFDSAQIRFLRESPEFEEVQELLKEAIRTWRNTEYTKSDPNRSPLYFEMRHALLILHYPATENYYTLKGHYNNGRKLVNGQNSSLARK